MIEVDGKLYYHMFMVSGLDSGLYTALFISGGANGFINAACFLAKTRAVIIYFLLLFLPSPLVFQSPVTPLPTLEELACTPPQD